MRAVVGVVAPSAQTVPVVSEGDAADDPAIWVHPSDASRSTIIGTDKQRGLVVYDLAGRVLQDLPVGRMNNVDVLYGFALRGALVDLVGATSREDDSIALFAVDPDSGALRAIEPRIPAGVGGVYGFCFFTSERTGRAYALLNTYDGVVQQWRLSERGTGVGAELVRVLRVGGLTEGMVADARTNALFVGEERVGVWKYEAEPDWLARGLAPGAPGAGRERDRALIAVVGRDPLAADVEGLAVYPAGDAGGGLLLVSSQGDSTFAVFGLEAPHRYLFSFVVGEGDGIDGIDGVSGADGIEVTAASLGPSFPNGVFVTQDDARPGSTQNFKLVDWDRIVRVSQGRARVVRGWDPRGAPGR